MFEHTPQMFVKMCHFWCHLWIYGTYTCRLQFLILNPCIPNKLRSDNPAKSYRSLHISDKWVGGFDREEHWHLSCQCSSHQTSIVLKTFKLQPLILNLYLRNTFRPDHLIKSVDRPPRKNIFSHSGRCDHVGP